MNVQTPTEVSVLSLDDRAWDSSLSGTTADVYYRRGYVRAYEKAGHGQAVALLVSAGENQFLMPLLLRPLAELDFAPGCAGFDAVTPYGYGGLLNLSSRVEVTRETIQQLWQALRGWCAEAGVVSIMLRLHPMLEQDQWFHAYGEGIYAEGAQAEGAHAEGVTLRPFGATVALDLQRWDPVTETLITLQKGRRSDLIGARRHLTVNWASDHPGEEYWRLFRNLYEERMDQLQAASFYHFPPEYYAELTGGLGDDLDIAIAWFEGQPVGGGVFMAGTEFAHDHLSATNEQGRAFRANTLLINEAAAWARRRGCRWLHLGGGTHADDPLFRFKKSFGGRLFHYSFVTFIADHVRYRRLTEMRLTAAHLPAPRPDFFPRYRA